MLPAHDPDSTACSLEKIIEGLRHLGLLNMIRSQRQICSEFGELLVADLAHGVTADPPTHPNWVVMSPTLGRIQVKTQLASFGSTHASSSRVLSTAFDLLIVVALDDTFHVAGLYKLDADRVAECMARTDHVPWSEMDPWENGMDAMREKYPALLAS